MKKEPLFYLKGKTIYQRAQEKSRIVEDGKTYVTTSVGFPVCTISQYVEGKDVCDVFNESVTPVSLEKCAIALWADRSTPWDEAGKTAQKQYRRMAKACLDAVRVKYD